MPIPKLLFFPELSPTGSRRLQLLQESKFSAVQLVRADHDLVCNVRQDQQLASTAQAAGHACTWRIHSDPLWQACHDLELMQFYGDSMIKARGGVRKKCSVLTKKPPMKKTDCAGPRLYSSPPTRFHSDTVDNPFPPTHSHKLESMVHISVAVGEQFIGSSCWKKLSTRRIAATFAKPA